MGKARLEAFSDGVLAIIITIMVLELKVPHGASLEVLRELCAPLAGYVLSFVYVGIWWNNHHHLLHTVKRVTGGVMWANMHLLFWLSLVPVTTGWFGENIEAVPAAAYGFVLMMCGVAWLILQKAIISGAGEELREAIGDDMKGKLSGVSYLGAIGLAFVSPWISVAIYVGIAIMWVIPDKRIERVVDQTALPFGSAADRGKASVVEKS